MMYVPSSWWANFFLSILLLRAFTSQIPILSYFTILKSYFINYTIQFYNTLNISKLYYFIILLKYYFLIVMEEEGKHKKQFFFSSSLIFFFIPSALSLSLFCLTSLLSGFDCAPVHAPVRSWDCAPVVDHGSWIVNL